MRIDAYLTFEDQTEAAFTFYQKCLGGKLDMMRFADMPGEGGCPGGEPLPESAKNRIMHASLALEDQLLMASDSFPDQPYEGIKGCMVALSYEDNAEAERVYGALLEGGKAIMPMEEAFWAERFGMLVDRFGVTWGVNGKSKM